MKNSTVTFVLRIDYYDSDAPSDKGKNVVLACPHLSVFSSAQMAAAFEEGLEIVEGDIVFFAADGSPLKANFSEKPYVDAKNKKYFAGAYSLEAGKGDNLQTAIEKIIASNASPHARIRVYATGDTEMAREYGWQSAKAMKDGIAQALKILPPELADRVLYE
jgi:hypothetical protein